MTNKFFLMEPKTMKFFENGDNTIKLYPTREIAEAAALQLEDVTLTEFKVYENFQYNAAVANSSKLEQMPSTTATAALVAINVLLDKNCTSLSAVNMI